jgi:hypothetical protein
LVDAAVTKPDLVWSTDVAVPFFGVGGNFLGYGVVFNQGSYNPNNKWNTTHGAIHLTHPANTLRAEINLGADATVLYPTVPQTPANTFASRLICCASYGGVNRSSDPNIGAGVNGLAAAGKSVTLENPVGLYISSVDLKGLADPDGNPMPSALVKRRQSSDGEKILRVEVRAPAGATYSLDECTLNLEALTSGGQIARNITMTLFGLAKQIPGRVGKTSVCKEKCCSRPSSPSFTMLVAPSRNCASLSEEDFARVGPFTGTTGPSPAPELLAMGNAAVADNVLESASLVDVEPGSVKMPAATRTVER